MSVVSAKINNASSLPGAARRGTPLSPREQTVFALICHGMNDKTIARE
jgi:DNA-binding NarL/FixJ family response regulator